MKPDRKIQSKVETRCMMNIWLTGFLAIFALLGVKGSSASSGEWINANATDNWSARSGHTSVVFDNKMWVIGGYASDGGLKNDVWYSTNGANWTQATPSAGWASRSSHTSVVFDNKLWVIGGGDSNGVSNDVWYSTDGANWTEATSSAEWSSRSGHTSVVFDNKIWVIGGTDEAPDPLEREHMNDVWYSEDGANWTLATPEAAWIGRDGHTSLVFGNKIWVIGGARQFMGPDDSVGLSDVWFSEDGITWTIAVTYASWTNRISHASVIFDNKMWIVAGVITIWFTYPEYPNDVWYSVNGADWLEMTSSAEWGKRYGHTCVVYDDKIWLLGGIEDTRKNDVWYFEMPMAAISPSIWSRYE